MRFAREPDSTSTMTEPTCSSSYRFGIFELQPNERRLLAGGEAVVLGPRAFDLLIALVERPGQLVTKEELLDCVCPSSSSKRTICRFRSPRCARSSGRRRLQRFQDVATGSPSRSHPATLR